MARTSARTAHNAWDIGRSGENAPEWVVSSPEMLEAYTEGVNGQGKPAAVKPTAQPSPVAAPAAATPVAPTAEPVEDPAPPPPPPRRSEGWVTRPLKGSGDGTGLLFGLLAYTVALNYIRGGPAGVRAWAAAKFLNRTPGSSKAADAPEAPFGTPSHTLPQIPRLTPGPHVPPSPPAYNGAPGYTLPQIPSLTPEPRPGPSPQPPG